MPVFVATYAYTADTETRVSIRPEHREWLTAQPSLLVSGPTDADGAILVFEGESAAAIEALLDHDPFAVHGGLIAERRVVGWTVVTGRLKDAFPAP